MLRSLNFRLVSPCCQVIGGMGFHFAISRLTRAGATLCTHVIGMNRPNPRHHPSHIHTEPRRGAASDHLLHLILYKINKTNGLLAFLRSRVSRQGATHTSLVFFWWMWWIRPVIPMFHVDSQRSLVWQSRWIS